MKFQCSIGASIILAAVFLSACERENSPQQAGAQKQAQNPAPAPVPAQGGLSAAQAQFVKAQLTGYDLSRYHTDGADWDMVLTRASGYKNIHPDSGVAHITIPIDADKLKADGSLSLEFLLELDPHRVSFNQTPEHREAVYLAHLRGMHRAGEAAYLQRITDYLRDTHGFTPERIEVARSIAHGILQRAESQGLRPSPNP